MMNCKSSKKDGLFNKNELDDFARHYGFHYDIIEPEALVRDFCVDMERGLLGESSSMPMIPSHLKPVSKVPPGKTVIALDAGGTNLRAARIHFDKNGKAISEAERNTAMPGTRGRLSAEEFYDEIAAAALPLLEEDTHIEGIGFCFSYPMDMTEDGDGLPLAFSKELDAPEAVGKPVGKGLRDALLKQNIKAPSRIVLLNDTAATLLWGIADIPPRFPDKTVDTLSYGEDTIGLESGPVIGFILGTGFNTAYPEKSIPKISYNSETPQIVVHESGTFLNRYQGILDKEFDASTKNPGMYTTEKAAAGAYLGPLSLHILKRAISDSVLQFKKSEQLQAIEKLETKDLNAFLNNPLALSGPLGKLFDSTERSAISSILYLESIISERAALLSAAVLAGTIEHIDGGNDPLVPTRIAVEGTTYLRFFHLRESLEARLRTLLSKTTPRHYIISPVSRASLFGAAVAALS
jgi:hexokinase